MHPRDLVRMVTKAMAMARNSSSPMQRLLRRNADATSLCERVGEPAARRRAVGADTTHGRVGLEDDGWLEGANSLIDTHGDMVSASIHHWRLLRSEAGRRTCRAPRDELLRASAKRSAM